MRPRKGRYLDIPHHLSSKHAPLIKQTCRSLIYFLHDKIDNPSLCIFSIRQYDLQSKPSLQFELYVSPPPPPYSGGHTVWGATGELMGPAVDKCGMYAPGMMPDPQLKHAGCQNQDDTK